MNDRSVLIDIMHVPNSCESRISSRARGSAIHTPPRRASSSSAIPTRSGVPTWLSCVSERLAAITKPEKHIPFAPDLAVEVLSPNDEDDEVEEKAQMWLRAGSLLVWNVDPENRTVDGLSTGCRARHSHRRSGDRRRRGDSRLPLPRGRLFRLNGSTLKTMYKLDQPPLLFESSRPGRSTAILPESDVPDRPLRH